MMLALPVPQSLLKTPDPAGFFRASCCKGGCD